MQSALELACWLYHLFLMLPWLASALVLIAWAFYLALGGHGGGDDL